MQQIGQWWGIKASAGLLHTFRIIYLNKNNAIAVTNTSSAAKVHKDRRTQWEISTNEM